MYGIVLKIFTWAAVVAVDVVCRLSGWAVEANRLGLTWVKSWLNADILSGDMSKASMFSSSPGRIRSRQEALSAGERRGNSWGLLIKAGRHKWRKSDPSSGADSRRTRRKGRDAAKEDC